jgi:hypothetical protein
MIAASYGSEHKDPRTFIPKHLTSSQQKQLLRLLYQYESVFNGELGILPGKPVELRLTTAGVRPYHGRAYPVPKIYETLVKDEVS